MNIKRMKIYIKIFSKGSRKVKIIKIIGHNIINTENLKTIKHHIFLKKHYVFLLFTVVMNIKKS